MVIIVRIVKYEIVELVKIIAIKKIEIALRRWMGDRKEEKMN